MGNLYSLCCRKLGKSFADENKSGNHTIYDPSGTVHYQINSSNNNYVRLSPDQLGLNGELNQRQYTDSRGYYLNSTATALINPPNSSDCRAIKYDESDSHYRKRLVASSETSDTMISSIYTQSSASNLQHISEREPEDTEEDPSLHPTKGTLFMQRSVRDIEASSRKRYSIYDRNASRHRQQTAHGLYRSSSTSSVLLDNSTVSRPEPKSTVHALAHAVYLQIKHRNRSCQGAYMPDIFDERSHPLQKEPVPVDYGNHDPDQNVVYRFIRNLFHMAQLSPECAIVTMVYLERLLTSAETELTPATWKRVVLCAILLASKVWDDQAVWNVDYCQILKDLDVNDVNKLERQFLEIIQFNINVPSSVYAKYYFDIRSLCGAARNRLPLSIERAHKLEAYSRVTSDEILEDLHKSRNQRRWNSMGSLLPVHRFRPAVLS